LIVPRFKIGDSVRERTGSTAGIIKQVCLNIQRLDDKLEISYLLDSGDSVLETDLDPN
jgi:hypothetical protein